MKSQTVNLLLISALVLACCNAAPSQSAAAVSIADPPAAQATHSDKPAPVSQPELIEPAREEAAKPAQVASGGAKPALSAKAERLLKGLSSFMNPAMNQAAYFVPAAPSRLSIKSQQTSVDIGPAQPSGRANRSASKQKQAAEGASGESAGPQTIAEPSALVNPQATGGGGIVSAPTRMARPQNYIFRWGRRR